MNDEQLHRMLSELPKEKASPGFTERVLEHLPKRKPKATRSPYRPLYLAAGLILVATMGLVYGLKLRHTAIQEQLRKEFNQLRAEHRLLTTTLADLRSKLRKTQPTVYLGGDQKVDYVLDAKDAFHARPAHFEGFR